MFLAVLGLLLAIVRTTLQLESSICWPDGTFTLARPQVGCPTGNATVCGRDDSLVNGFLKVSTEQGNAATPDNHLRATVGSDTVKLSFCTKKTVSQNNITWPLGCYCLFSYNCSSLPGFEEGNVTWYATFNGSNGKVPDGSYIPGASSVTLKFCCQCDTIRRLPIPIDLPNSQPFYLLMHYMAGNTCQLVRGMDVQPEHILWNTENSQVRNIFSSPYPSGADALPDPFIVFCYYSPSEPIVPTTSPSGAPFPIQSSSTASPSISPPSQDADSSVLISEITIPLVAIVCATVVVVVIAVVAGIVCAVRQNGKKGSAFTPNALGRHPNSVLPPVPPPPDDSMYSGYYCEVRDPPQDVFVNSLASDYGIQMERHYSLDPTNCTSALNTIQETAFTNEDASKVVKPSRSTSVPGNAPQIPVLEEEDDSDDLMSDIYEELPCTEAKLHQFIGKRKNQVSIAMNTITIQQLLGEGQFGEVSKAIWKRSEKNETDVAVKMLKEQKPKEKEKVQFLQEAAIMGQFQHPNVVSLLGIVYDLDTSNLCQMIVMEFLSNGTLSAHLRNGFDRSTIQGQASEKLLQFSRQVATGMNYLAKKKFVHRDLAARNILLDENLVCKIADFGMTRDMDDSYYYKAHGGMVPVRWTAPEALAYKKYSTASDVWSYGCVLYEIWSLGASPLSGLDIMETFTKLLCGYRQSPSAGCPRMVYGLMIDAWHPTPSHRPTFSEICSALKQPRECVLKWIANDQQVHPQSTVLGAGSAIGQLLYPDLQSKYINSNVHR